MKKLTLTVIALTLTLITNAQMIEKVVDDMTDKTNYYSTINLIVANESKTEGVTIVPSIRNKNGKLTANSLICSIVGLGVCNESNKMIIMFDDETKFTLTSWNKFNCKGNAYFDLDESQVQELATKPIKKIRFTNGKSYESVTNTPSRNDYFINFYDELNKLK